MGPVKWTSFIKMKVGLGSLEKKVGLGHHPSAIETIKGSLILDKKIKGYSTLTIPLWRSFKILIRFIKDKFLVGSN